MLRFTLPRRRPQPDLRQRRRRRRVAVDRRPRRSPAGRTTRSGLSNGAARMFVYGTFDQPVADVADAAGPHRLRSRFDGTGKTVTLRIATSFISSTRPSTTSRSSSRRRTRSAIVADRARRAWDTQARLIVSVEGATEDQLTTLYSNLYRLNLYPNSAFENTGTARTGLRARRCSRRAASDPRRTGAPVVGRQDLRQQRLLGHLPDRLARRTRCCTPRTPASSSTASSSSTATAAGSRAGRHPATPNLMTGTSSDVAFADAYVKGVKRLDAQRTYDAALKNATVAPPGDPSDPNVGRKGLDRLAVPRLHARPRRRGRLVGARGRHQRLRHRQHGRGARATRHAAPSASATARSPSTSSTARPDYVNLFDPRIGFFQGRDATAPSSPIPPTTTRASGATTTTTPRPTAGTSPSTRRRTARASRTSTAAATRSPPSSTRSSRRPETAKFPGSYGGTIHEMIEARDVRMGQWGFSNQVSHHIPYMYDYAGQPSKTQAKVREALRRLYSAAEIGQGYPGDEDNGEMSAWYLFTSLGFYPLQVGSPYYAIGSPLFDRATVHFGDGASSSSARPTTARATSTCRACGSTAARTTRRTYATPTSRTAGRSTSAWARGRRAGARHAPPRRRRSPTATGRPQPLHDATDPHSGTVSADELFDDTRPPRRPRRRCSTASRSHAA